MPLVDLVSLSRFSLNFLNLPQIELYRAAEIHFKEDKWLDKCNSSIWVKINSDWISGNLLICGKVYAYV